MPIPELVRIASAAVAINAARASGSGTCIAHIGMNSYILTCAHVLDDEEKRVLVGSWRGGKWHEVPANVALVDEANDLALLRTTKRLEHIAPATIADTEPDLYEKVFVVGSGSDLYGLASEGLLCGTRGSTRTTCKNYYVYTGLSCPGMSGGPLANDEGELIGVILAVDKNGHLPIWSIGYAMALPIVTEFLTKDPALKVATKRKLKSSKRLRR